MAFTFTWDNTAAQVWATNHWGRGGAPLYPGAAGSTVDDIVVIGTVVPPTGGPLAALTVAEYTCKGSTFDCGANLTVTKNLTIGTALGVDAPIFSGVALPGCLVLFQGASENAGTVGDWATFNDNTKVQAGATVGDYATFNDTSYNSAGALGDWATFNGTAYNDAGTVNDYATFNDGGYNNAGVCGDFATFNSTASNVAGTVGDYATFNDASTNDAGTVGDYATFNGTAYMAFLSVVGDYATFNDAALKDAGTVGDWATFNGSSYNNGGVCGDFATFNSTGTQSGLFGGAQYYVYAPTVFDPTTWFTGAPPIAFKLCGPLASVAAAVTSDGGATPLETLFDLAAAAAIGPFPITITAIGPFPLDSDGLGPYPVTY